MTHLYRLLCVLVILFCFPLKVFPLDVKMKLTQPRLSKELTNLLEKRYSCRSFKAKPLRLDDVSGILWAACGKKSDAVTGATRTIPSAGAAYPLELYIVVGNNCVDNLKAGIYHYIIEEHALQLVSQGDKRQELSSACLGQDYIAFAPVSLVFTGITSRTAARYGERAQRYCYMEAGHACQNTYLAVTDLGLGTVEVGAFLDKRVALVLGLDQNEIPLSVMPIGYAK
jgi:SagB-type dehydrogenase family enzyme